VHFLQEFNVQLNQATAAIIMACNPVFNVGLITGANLGEWLLGIEFS
jgi:hypothetical protein